MVVEVIEDQSHTSDLFRYITLSYVGYILLLDPDRNNFTYNY